MVVKTEIENNPYFIKLNPKQQKEILKGNWRIHNSWSDLAVKAGFGKVFFDEQYKFLCGYAHSSRLSIIQIQQVGDFENQRQMAFASIGTIMVVLAKHMYDYVNLIPELKSLVDFNSPEFRIIDIWKSIGNKL